MAEQKTESEVAKKLDLSVIRYSRVVEDHRVLSRALQITQDKDVVMCITSSGDNVLNLLLDRPKKMIAIDISHAQNSLLEIKLAAIRHLQYRDYLCLLGEKDEESSQNRLELYEQVRALLPRYAQEFWDGHKEIIQDGMSEQGRLERYLRKMNDKLYQCFDIKLMDTFFSARDLTEQKAAFEQFPMEEMKKIQFQVFSQANQTEGRSTAQLKYVKESEEETSKKLWERLCAVCTKLPVKDNFYLSWYFRGRRGFDPESNPTMAPPFLTEDGFTKLKGLVERVEVLTCSIEEYFNKNSRSCIDKVGLSDVFEYMSEEDAAATFELLAKSVASGGRVAFWNLFNRRAPSQVLLQGGKMTYLDELSKQLHHVDRLFFYSAFHVVGIN